MTEEELDQWPHLKANPDAWLRTSEDTDSYNCVAWALWGAAPKTYRWWWPDPWGEHYWPRSVERKATLQAFLDTFMLYSFIPCNDGQLEEGSYKLAIYSTPTGEPKHVARQLISGEWTSKLGDLEDIRHGTLDLLESDLYGLPIQYMKRQRTGPDPEPPLPIRP